MSLAALIRNMASAGASAEVIALAVEAVEAAEAKVEAGRAAARDRKRRQREKDVTVTGQSRDTDGTVTDETPSPFLPSPPDPPTPPTPTREEKSPARKGRSAEPADQPLLDTIWDAANPVSRGRSGRPATSRAITAALAKGATPEALLASVQHHCRVSGEHPKGLHRIIEAELWRDHLAKPQASTRPPDPQVIAGRQLHFAKTGEWRADWGPRPTSAPAQDKAA